jgi:hypothetical protein
LVDCAYCDRCDTSYSAPVLKPSYSFVIPFVELFELPTVAVGGTCGSLGCMRDGRGGPWVCVSTLLETLGVWVVMAHSLRSLTVLLAGHAESGL